MKTHRLLIPRHTDVCPDGRIVTVGVPWPRSVRRRGKPLLVDDGSRTVAAQARELSAWPDGSIQWSLVAFPLTPKAWERGFVQLSPGRAAPAETAPLSVKDRRDAVQVDTGTATFTVSRRRLTLLDQVRLGDRDMLSSDRPSGWELKDGESRLFRSAADEAPEVDVLEAGPYRVLVRQRGVLRCPDVEDQPLHLDARIALTAGASRAHVLVTYTCSDEQPSLYLRDLRWVIEHALEQGRTFDIRGLQATAGQPDGLSRAPDDAMPRFAVGCGHNDAYEDHVDHDSRYFLLQETADYHNLYQEDPGWQRYPVASGAARGRRAPGWMHLRGTGGQLLWSMRDFWQSCPKEIEITAETAAFGIWPQRAIPVVSCLRQMPEPSDPHVRWTGQGPECLTTFPYFTGFSLTHDAYELLRGAGRTHDFTIEFLPPEADVDPAAWARDQAPATVARPAPVCVDNSNALGPLAEADGPDDEVLDRAHRWRRRVAELAPGYGELDWGDLPAFFPTLAMARTAEGTMRTEAEGGFLSRCDPEAGFWSNQQGDAAHGAFLQFLRTGDRAYWDDFLAGARHTMEVDLVRARFGVVDTAGRPAPLQGPARVGPQEGHRYRGLAGFRMKDNRLDGLLDYYHATGDPRGLEAARLVADYLAEAVEQAGDWPGPEPLEHSAEDWIQACGQLSTACLLWGERSHRDAAQAACRMLLEAVGETEHGGARALALVRYLQVEESTDVLEAACQLVDRIGQVDSLAEAGRFADATALGEAMGRLFRMTGQERFAKAGRRLLESMRQSQDRSGHPILDGNWNGPDRAPSVHTAAALGHLPILISALA